MPLATQFMVENLRKFDLHRDADIPFLSERVVLASRAHGRERLLSWREQALVIFGALIVSALL